MDALARKLSHRVHITTKKPTTLRVTPHVTMSGQGVPQCLSIPFSISLSLSPPSSSNTLFTNTPLAFADTQVENLTTTTTTTTAAR